MSIKKQILEATLKLFRSEDNTDLSIPHLSDFSGISITDIESNYDTIEQIVNDLFEFRTNEHFERSEEILKNADPLQNLLHHDLEFTYRVDFFTKKYEANSYMGKLLSAEAIKNTKEKMATFYGRILESNSYLLPEDLQDAALYSKFITHSLFFLTKENLKQILPSSMTKESATLQVIESLFPKIDLGFQIA
jgi:hypothetical protein